MKHAMRALRLNLKHGAEGHPVAAVVVGVVLASGVFFGLLALAHGCETKAVAVPLVEGPREAPAGQPTVPPVGPGGRHFRVTAYCPCEKCCGRWADGITASGTRADHRLVAAPREFPFGTEMRIPGYGTVRVEDRGGAIRGDRLDVLFPTHAEALVWGVQWLDVAVGQ